MGVPPGVSRLSQQDKIKAEETKSGASNMA